MKKERFEAITDAVLAIIMTLMILEIKIPEITVENLPIILQQILIYAISFVSIAILWLNHHHIFANIKTVSLNLVWLNFVLLFFTSLLPIATEHLSINFHHKANHIFFGLSMAIVTTLYSLIQLLVMKNNPENYSHKTNRRNWLSVSLWALSIPLCFVSIYLSGIIFLLVPTMYFLVSNKSIS
ncbi:MAG: DUF1211 domain-containing protein [Bacteroidetes bacterium]|nr:DUF1211 domain-containing protein [Bacteroidota bacterium]